MSTVFVICVSNKLPSKVDILFLGVLRFPLDNRALGVPSSYCHVQLADRFGIRAQNREFYLEIRIIVRRCETSREQVAEEPSEHWHADANYPNVLFQD